MYKISNYASGLAAVALMVSAAVAAEPPQPVNLNVQVYKARAVVKINGIPTHYIQQTGPKVSKLEGGGTYTDSSPENLFDTDYLSLCRNGDNTIEVEATITGSDGQVQMQLQKSSDDPVLFNQTLSKSGTLSYTLNKKDLPEWAWTHADAVADGKTELLKAVAEYQQAYAKKDAARIDAFEHPYFDDLVHAGVIPASALKQALKERAQALPSQKLRPLVPASDLVAESYLGGKLYVVTDRNHHAPVRQEMEGEPEMTNDVGKYWSRIGGKWYVVKLN